MNSTLHTKENRPSLVWEAIPGAVRIAIPPLVLAALAGLLSFGASAQTLSSYQDIISSQGPMSWFKFDNGGRDDGYTYTNAVAANNATLTVYGTGGVSSGWLGGPAADAFHTPGKSVYFSGSADVLDAGSSVTGIINGGGLASTESTAEGTICCLFRTLNAPVSGRRPIFWSGGDISTSNALAMWIESQTAGSGTNDIKVRFGADTRTMLPATNILYSTWYYFALTYTEAATAPVDSSGTNLIKAKWYLGRVGGTLLTGTIATVTNAVAGDGSHLVIGNVYPQYNVGFRGAGNGRIDEFVTWNRQLSPTEISNQFAALPQLPPPGATYQQVVDSQTPKYFFKLDNSLAESVGGTLQLTPVGTGGAFTADFYGNPDQAYSFSRTNDALYIANDLINGGGPVTNDFAKGVGTISFQFRMLSDTNYEGQRFIFSAPGEEDYGTNDNMLALYLENSVSTNPWPGSLKLRVGNLTKGSTGSSTPENNVPVAYVTNLVPNAWYYFAMTYDENRNSPEVYLYFGQAGGTLAADIADPANRSVVGNNDWLVLGNKIESFSIGNSAFRNPGQGAIDAFAIWHDELSPAEIRAQFAALVLPPTLNIAQVGTDLVLSWPTNGSAGFQLKASPSLSSPAWSDAGAPTVVGALNCVTNSPAGTAQFYRLEKP